MEPVVPSGEMAPFSEGSTDILTVVDDFENIYDVPFVTVNRIGDEIQAEVHLSGMWDVDHDRISAAQAVAGELGFRAYARIFGDLYGGSAVTILFTNDPAQGLIWALENEMVDDWSR